MEQRSFVLFNSAIRTEATRKTYTWFLKRFATHYEIESYDLLCSLGQARLARMLEDFILFHKEKGKSPSWLRLSISSLELFFSQNDLVLNWKKLKRMVPQANQCCSGKTAYDNQDIKAMLQNTNVLRTKALVHFMASTGARIGSIPELKLKDLVLMERNCLAVKVYAGSPDEYWAFLTSQAANVFFRYLWHRKSRYHEKLTPESSAFTQRSSSKPITKQAISCLIKNLLKKCRQTRAKVSEFRYDKMLTHGFRKRTATIIKMRNDISYSVSEILLGHKPYLDQSYFVPTPVQLFDEFRKVESGLFVSEGGHQQLVVY